MYMIPNYSLKRFIYTNILLAMCPNRNVCQWKAKTNFIVYGQYVLCTEFKVKLF